jgi:hypothetical protein
MTTEETAAAAMAGAPLEAARRVTVEVMEMKTTMVATSTTTVETQWRRWRRRAR